jgi:uncharacterized membrane protein YhaH (DUF805 family)
MMNKNISSNTNKKSVFKKQGKLFFDPRGTLSKRRYQYATLLIFIINLAFILIFISSFSQNIKPMIEQSGSSLLPSMNTPFIYALLGSMIVSSVSMLILSAKRARDVGLSPYVAVGLFLPYVSIILSLFLFLFFKNGKSETFNI